MSEEEESTSSTESTVEILVPDTVQSVVRAGGADDREELEDGKALTVGGGDGLGVLPTKVVDDAEVDGEVFTTVEAEDVSLIGEEIELRGIDPASGPTQLVPVNPAGVVGFVLA